ncbi:TPA: hypothetical protein ACPVXB_005072 [Vibrio parahaemolyticus]
MTNKTYLLAAITASLISSYATYSYSNNTPVMDLNIGTTTTLPAYNNPDFEYIKTEIKRLDKQLTKIGEYYRERETLV